MNIVCWKCCTDEMIDDESAFAITSWNNYCSGRESACLYTFLLIVIYLSVYHLLVSDMCTPAYTVGWF